MKIFSAQQIQKWDAFTMEHNNISSEELMEKAAAASTQWLIKNLFPNAALSDYKIICGKGNNGGDGLAIARLLIKEKYSVKIFIVEIGSKESKDFIANLKKLQGLTPEIYFIKSKVDLPLFEKNDIIIDALFGTGLNKPLDELPAIIVKHINNSKSEVVAIDIPSGMMCDTTSKELTVIQAGHTLSFSQKLAFMMAENEKHTGQIHQIDIGLHPAFALSENCQIEITEHLYIKSLIKPRSSFAHKGTFGSAAIIAGSYGMMGAAVLAAKGYLRSGAGKLTTHIPSCGYNIMQTVVPEAMCKISGTHFIDATDLPNDLDAIGIGPGIGRNESNTLVLQSIFRSGIKMVIDADALNTIGLNKTLIQEIPEGTVITPHPKEFERIFGMAKNDFHRLNMAIENAARYKIYILLKGHHTAIISPEGEVYFNNTGNSGMAKPGMGDILTGLITGLLAQQYSQKEACIIAAYLNGLAGDIAAELHSQQALTAIDVINCLGQAWKKLLD